MRVLAEGRADVREIVAVTFTEKAAGELKLRLRQRLEEERRNAAIAATSSSGSNAAVQNLEEAHVSTIHGFCADLLRERPVEARVDPLFRVLTEGQAERLFNEAFDTWFQAVLADAARRRAALAAASQPRQPSRRCGRGRPIERLRRAGFDADASGATSASRGRASRSIGPTAIARLVDLVHELADRLEVAVVRRRQPVRRHRAGAAAEPRPEAHAAGRERGSARRTGVAARRAATQPRLQARTEGERTDVRQGRHTCAGARGARPADAWRSTTSAASRRRLGRAAARGAARLRRQVRGAEGARGRARLPRSAGSRARSGAGERRKCARTFRAASAGSSSTSSRTPIRCRPSCCCCWRPTIRTRRAGSTSLPSPASCSSSAIRSSRSIASGARTWTSIDACATCSSSAAPRPIELRKSFRSVPNIQRVVNAAFAPVMDGDRETHAGAVRARSSRIAQRSLRAALGGRAAGAGAVRPAIRRGAGDRALPARRGGRVRRLAGEQERLDGHRAPQPRSTGAARGAAHLHPVPPVRQLRRGHHAGVRRSARGARRQAPAGRRQGVPRSRGDRNAARGADGDRVA